MVAVTALMVSFPTENPGGHLRKVLGYVTWLGSLLKNT